MKNFRKIFKAVYDGITVTVGVETVDGVSVPQVRTCDPDNGIIKSIVTPAEMIDTICECLDDEWALECTTGWASDHAKQWYETAIYNSVVC